jgi:ketosteroid isomerase-like protein
MTMKILTATAIVAFAFGASNVAIAQTPSWSAEQTAVWKVVSESYVDEVAKNGKWPNAYVHDQVVSWSAASPIPKGKASIEKWARFNDSQSKTLQYEIHPVAIAVSGDTAVVHYTGMFVSQRGTDKPETEVNGTIETLVRSGGQWKFLSLTGFDMKKK